MLLVVTHGPYHVCTYVCTIRAKCPTVTKVKECLYEPSVDDVIVFAKTLVIYVHYPFLSLRADATTYILT